MSGRQIEVSMATHLNLHYYPVLQLIDMVPNMERSPLLKELHIETEP
ncbi:hypothetical protein PEC311524_43940 [Pectobacterium carotovorum subsp. carotovorum]|nr:hypothetical protein PEC311524_43940 [Pectobacterium carotovorum subsp. carotovorum]